MGFAARVSDFHICPMVTGVVPHIGGPVLPPGTPTVLIGGMPALNNTSQLICDFAGDITIIEPGEFTVMVP